MLSDCLKYRNKPGVVLESLKLYKLQKSYSLDMLFKYARICRVEKVKLLAK